MPSDIRPTSGAITLASRWDHFLARSAIRRGGHLVQPGLFALGNPMPGSPVFVTSNYTLSFDWLRSVLAGTDCYILVLSTEGINVWCAAGKGTFGTDELVHRIEATGLSEVVTHRMLILPQLGAPGISAHEVEQRSGFKVEYGPARAAGDAAGALRPEGPGCPDPRGAGPRSAAHAAHDRPCILRRRLPGVRRRRAVVRLRGPVEATVQRVRG